MGGVRTALVPNTQHTLGAINTRREKGWLSALPKTSCMLLPSSLFLKRALCPLPKMSYMLLFFPPSQRELNKSAAYASSVRDRRESLTGGWTAVNMKGVEA